MSNIIARANASNWSKGEIITALQINTLDQNPVTLAEYLEALAKDVTLFGATGDGATDDSSAIASALTAASAASVPCYFPPGNYMCNGLTWPSTVDLLGVPGASKLYNNHATNPILTSTATDGTGVAPAKGMYGLQLHLNVSNNPGRLVTVTGNTRVDFRKCYFNDGGNAGPTGGVPSGLIQLGDTGKEIRATFYDCGFRVTHDDEGQAIGIEDGTTYVTAIGCRFALVNGARTQMWELISGSHLRILGCDFDFSAATAASTYMFVLGCQTANGSITAQGNYISDAAGGQIRLSSSVSTVEIHESGNRLPTGAQIDSGTISDNSNLGSRLNRHAAVTQSGGGTLTLDTLSFSSFYVSIDDTTAFTLAASAGTLGLEIDVILHRNGGSPSGAITYDTSTFAGFSSVNDGTAMPAAILTNNYATQRFRWSNGPDGERWYPIGSALVAS